VETYRTLGFMEPSEQTLCGDLQDVGSHGTFRADSMWRLTGHGVFMEPSDETLCGD
jgi:hypothetical protein